MIPDVFLNHAADILGATEGGLSGSKIAQLFSAYSVDMNVPIPFPEYPFPKELSNKRTALRENLKAFSPSQQFKIIKELCELENFKQDSKAKDLKVKLISRYGNLSTGDLSEVNEVLVDETRHWLEHYPSSFKLYNEAVGKFDHRIFQRNLLDDLRLSLELLLQEILKNKKSLENQLPEVGKYIEERKGSKELSNMFVKLLDYYSKYQNTYVKHDDGVIEGEIEYIIEITSCFMKFLIKIN